MSGPWPSWRIERLGTVTSTQDLAKDRWGHAASAQGADPAAVDGLVLLAEAQLGGRGRRARDWSSPAGGVYLTAILSEHHLARSEPGRWSPAAALGLAEALQKFDARVGVKWPNDLYLDGGPLGPAKLGGLLLERHAGALLIGVGINVRNPVPAGAAALRRVPMDQVVDATLRGLADGLQRHAYDPGSFSERWPELDVLHGHWVSVQEGSRTLSGKVAGLAADGALRLVNEQGTFLARSGRVRWSWP